MPSPALRGSCLRALVSTLPPGAGADGLAAEARAAAAKDDAWTPLAPVLELAAGLLRASGPAALLDWGTAGSLAAMQGAPFGALVEAARLEAGCEPAILLARACDAAAGALRGCGALSLVGAAEDGATVLQERLPPALREEPWLLLTAGILRAIPIACGLEAEVAVRAEPATGRAHHDLGWWVPGALQR